MAKRWKALPGVGLLVVAGLALVLPTPRLVLFGLLNNETTYRGRPTRYWTHALSAPGGAGETVRVLKKGGSEAVPMLIEALGDADPRARYAAAEALGAIGPDAVASLVEPLKAGDPLVRTGAARALALIGPDARGALPALSATLHDDTTLVAVMAATALGRIGKEAVPVLSQALDEPNEVIVRRTILEALRRLGPEAAAAVPVLLKICADIDNPVYDLAAETLKKVDAAAAAQIDIP
jgi:HEAT repeat protein